MSRIDPVWAGVAELSRAFGARTLSPVDAVDALLERIRRRNPSLHAFIAVYEADARLVAEGADRAIRAGHRVGPLHGVPIALKDLVDLEGRVTTGGSKVWADRVSPVTATLAERRPAVVHERGTERRRIAAQPVWRDDALRRPHRCLPAHEHELDACQQVAVELVQRREEGPDPLALLEPAEERQSLHSSLDA